FASRLEAAAARLSVGRELWRSAVDEAGEDRYVRVARGLYERQAGGVGRHLFGCASRRSHTDTTAADVVAITRQCDALRGEQHIGHTLLHARREPREIVRPPRAGRAE